MANTSTHAETCPHEPDFKMANATIQKILDILEDRGVDRPGLVSRFRVVEEAHREVLRTLRTIKNTLIIGVVTAILGFGGALLEDHFSKPLKVPSHPTSLESK